MFELEQNISYSNDRIFKDFWYTKCSIIEENLNGLHVYGFCKNHEIKKKIMKLKKNLFR